ncbi:hypothetical protein EON76_05120 [bacterium]|nr:MAG: hypothetical protein EON76_05120 [bacterium]
MSKDGIVMVMAKAEAAAGKKVYVATLGEGKAVKIEKIKGSEMTEDDRLIKSAKSARDGNVSEVTIPEDVWLAAIAALDGHGELRIIEVIDRAILAERSRSSKVIEEQRLMIESMRQR